MATYISRAVAAAGGGAGVQLGGGGWGKPYPALVEFLTLSEWEAGVVRKTGTILVFVEDGAWKACLRDRDGVGRVAFVAADSPEGVLAAVEKALRASSLDWRVQQVYGKKGGK